MENETIDPIYKKGFEHGYWLQRGQSKDLDQAIEGSKNYMPYNKGLRAGRKEAVREKVKDRLQSNNGHLHTSDNGIDLD